MSATSATETSTSAPKFSRYRSVRRAAAAPIAEDTPAIPEQATSQLNRAPSRYHRANRQRTQTVPLPTQPAAKTVPGYALACRPQAQYESKPSKSIAPVQTTQLPQDTSGLPVQDADHEFTGGPVKGQRVSGVVTPTVDCHVSQGPSRAARSPKLASPRSYEAAREEARMILEGEYDRLQKKTEPQRDVERRRSREDTDLKRKPTQIQPSKPQPVYPDAPNLNVKMKIDRKLPDHYHDAPRSIGLKQQPKKLPQQPQRQEKPLKAKTSLNAKQPVQSATHTSVDVPVPPTVKQFDAPKFDAPISAVNAGDRRVELRFNNATRGITLPVTPTTDSKDLLNSASVVMSENFDPRTCILVESFSQRGLERPLRRYEHIRDVMNSWDTDDQNHLTIMTESECHATGLARNEVPEDAPDRVMIQMHLSSRPGKWEKRWVILRADGQVTSSKHENDGEGTNICHLSDFDVYTPTPAQRKKLRPPRKICFAIKSQQKSAMFLEDINFVHFFATSDKKVADRWYQAVQTWRSWYLVYVLGEGKHKVKEPTAGALVASQLEARPTTAQSAESIPYQLGSFKPLLDFGDVTFASPVDNSTSDPKSKFGVNHQKASLDLGRGRPSFDIGLSETARYNPHQKALPPSAFSTKILPEMGNRGRTSIDNPESAFTGGGLLGRSMSTRRSQGTKSSGQGVSGVPGRPLVDLTPASDFADGSLLRKLEAWSATQGEFEPKIDRQRRVEASIRVGEGL